MAGTIQQIQEPLSKEALIALKLVANQIAYADALRTGMTHRAIAAAIAMLVDQGLLGKLDDRLILSDSGQSVLAIATKTGAAGFVIRPLDEHRVPPIASAEAFVPSNLSSFFRNHDVRAGRTKERS